MKNVFEGCMPVEVMAKRGAQTLTFGPLKPVGLENLMEIDHMQLFNLEEMML